MSLVHAFAATAILANPESLDTFRSHLDPKWIEAALEATGVATMRRRRLPAEQVVWVVLGMAMFRDQPIEAVVSKLDLALPGVGTAARSSIAQARARLGHEPMKWLFETSAAKWATDAAVNTSWRGLALYGIDGSSLRVPDSDDNRIEFGGQTGRDGTESAYPLVRIVSLMALRSHLLRGVSVSSYADASELGEAAPLFALVPDASLTIVDKAYLAAAPLFAIQRGGTDRHWLTRAKANTAYRIVERLKKGDEIVEMHASSAARAADPTLPKTFLVRAIHYQRAGYKPSVLLTSLLDAKAYPASEIVALYHERWEIELAYDEIKTHMLDREEAIRSRKPDGVRQELWGIFLAYNMVRLEMARCAAEAKVPPTRISFLESVRQIRSEWDWLAISQSPGSFGKHLRKLRASLKRYVLPPRRDRLFPRAVKIKMSAYPRKRPFFEIAKLGK